MSFTESARRRKSLGAIVANGSCACTQRRRGYPCSMGSMQKGIFRNKQLPREKRGWKPASQGCSSYPRPSGVCQRSINENCQAFCPQSAAAKLKLSLCGTASPPQAPQHPKFPTRSMKSKRSNMMMMTWVPENIVHLQSFTSPAHG